MDFSPMPTIYLLGVMLQVTYNIEHIYRPDVILNENNIRHPLRLPLSDNTPF